MKKYKISAQDLLKDIQLATKERAKLGKRTLVRIIPEEGVDYELGHNALERFLYTNQCPAFLDEYGAGVESDYSIDLNKINVVFPNKSDE